MECLPTVMVMVMVTILSYVTSEAPPLPYASIQSAAYENSDEKLQQPESGSYVERFGSGAEGFNIQSGFKGYLVPSTSGSYPYLPLEAIESGTGILSAAKPFAKLALKFIPKLGILAFGIVALFVIGGIFTTAVCTFTPVCTISFLGFGFNKETMRSYLTRDRLSSTASFVLDAIKKAQELYDTKTNEIETDSEKKTK